MKLVVKSGQTGFAHIFIVLLLLAGIVLGVYLVQQRTNLFPKAASTPVGPETSFSFSNPLFADNGRNYALVGESFSVTVTVRSDLTESNLFVAKIKFDPKLVQVGGIKTDTGEAKSFIKNWIENYYDNTSGEISLTGGVPDPGFKTAGPPGAAMATIFFDAKASGTADLTFLDGSQIFSNADNINILSAKRGISVDIASAVASPQPSFLPSASPFTPAPTASGVLCAQVFTSARNSVTGQCKDFPTPCDVPAGWVKVATCAVVSPAVMKGDLKADGKIDLVDASVFFSKCATSKVFNKASSSAPECDLNEDNLVNTFDLSSLIKLLIDNQTIRSR